MGSKKGKVDKPVMRRDRKQYKQFRAAFKKWLAKYRPQIARARMSTEGVTIYNDKGKAITNYFAPDYTKYLRYMMRAYI